MSRDEVEDSRAFANSYGIAYPLLSDLDGALSRALVGIDTNDHTIPGVVVIRRDGAIVFRQIATSKDDRLSARELLDAVDRSLGTTGALVEDKQPAFHRLQLRADVGFARIREGTSWVSRPVLQPAVAIPLGRFVITSLGFETVPTEAWLSLRGSLGVRLPLLDDLGAIQLTAEAGVPLDAPGVYAGGRLGLWYAVTPRLAVSLAGSVGTYDTGAADQRLGWTTTLGLSRLIGR